MQTDATSAGTAPSGDQPVSRCDATQKVLIVNGNSDALESIEALLDAGHYDVVFVESSAHAYSQIKRVQPDLVILCAEMDDPDGLSVLSMLKLDADTRNIQVVTCATTGAEESADEEEKSDTPLFTARPALRMN